MEYLQRCPYKLGNMSMLTESSYMDSLSFGREPSLLYGRYWPPLFWYYYYQGYNPPPAPLDVGSPFPLSPSVREPWSTWHSLPGDLAYKRGIDHRESPNKELPTKLSKYDRMKDRHDLPGTLNFDQEHLAKLNSKKCAGTQTSFSGFVGDRYLPEGSVRHEPYSVTPRCATPHEVRQPSLSPLHRRSPPPAYPHGDASQNIPLNLSIGNSTGENHKLSPLRQLLRPSVITCAPAGNKFSVTDHSQSFSAAIRREINSVGGCDPAIEEHFRRSLGKDYPECLPSKSSSRSSSPLVQAASPGSQSEKAVSITGSVDDHFAKSLGDSTWSQIKAKNDPVPFDMFSGSVDDHFAKALGDTWLRIKAEKETDPSSSTCSSQPASPRQHPSIIST